MTAVPQDASLLLIEDHADIAQMLYEHLAAQGYRMDYAGDGLSGLRLAAANTYDAIVLDLMLPRLDGLALCRQLREEHGRDTPVLMLTARDSLRDKVTGLDAGADDYLIKPFDLAELDARLRALLRRRRGQVAHGRLQVADLTLDTDTRTVCRGGHTLALTPTGFTILTVLMRASPRVVGREALERAVWGDDAPDSDTLRSHLYTLRKAIDKPFDSPLLHTVQATGVRLAALDED